MGRVKKEEDLGPEALSAPPAATPSRPSPSLPSPPPHSPKCCPSHSAASLPPPLATPPPPSPPPPLARQRPTRTGSPRTQRRSRTRSPPLWAESGPRGRCARSSSRRTACLRCPAARQGRAHTGGPPTAPRPAPQGDEELFEMTMLNPTLLSEMSLKTRFLFLEARAAGKEAAESPPC